MLLQDSHSEDSYPVLIEYKGYKNKLVKLDTDGRVQNKKANNDHHFTNINSFAVNGAVHYATAVLHHTNYSNIIAIGITGYKDDNKKIKHKIGVYFLSKDSLGEGQEVKPESGEYEDLSFLSPNNFDAFIDDVKNMSFSKDEYDMIKAKKEREIDVSLIKLNNDIYENEKGLGENDRVYLVASSIIATIGISSKVPVLEKEELKSQTFKGGRDGDIVLNRIKAFLTERRTPEDKKESLKRL